MRINVFIALLFILTSFIIGCKKEVILYGSSTFPLSAGLCSVNDETPHAFTYKINGLNAQQNLDFFVGNSFFNLNWVESPSSTTARDGLGPLFNAKSCSSCHFKDGRGAPLFEQGLLLRLSTPFGDDPNYGGQFQNFSISTAQREGNAAINYTEIAGNYPDGSSYSLRKPTYTFNNLNYGTMHPQLMVSPRVGPQMIGLGLLELISENDLITNADPFDSNNDGISGKANYVLDANSNTTRIGRFGWKANVASMEDQVASAFNGDIGIKTSLHNNENYTPIQSLVLQGLPDGGILEIENDDFDKVVLYSRTLAVPVRRGANISMINKGEEIFRDLQCIKCHQPAFKTGNEGNIAALKNVWIRPYTDLLLHDMGNELSDNRPDGLASGNEWRTPPLWGIGLIQTVNSHTFLLHDGRARSIEEAILWHGGEAETSKNEFKSLGLSDRQKLIAFLNSL